MVTTVHFAIYILSQQKKRWVCMNTDICYDMLAKENTLRYNHLLTIHTYARNILKDVNQNTISGSF